MVKFSEMKYERPDTDAVKAGIARLVAAFRTCGSYEEARALLLEKDRLERHVDSMATLANIRHSIDTRDEFYDREASYWDDTMPELEEAYHEWTLAMLDSPYRRELAGEFGDVIFINA